MSGQLSHATRWNVPPLEIWFTPFSLKYLSWKEASGLGNLIRFLNTVTASQPTRGQSGWHLANNLFPLLYRKGRCIFEDLKYAESWTGAQFVSVICREAGFARCLSSLWVSLVQARAKFATILIAGFSMQNSTHFFCKKWQTKCSCQYWFTNITTPRWWAGKYMPSFIVIGSCEDNVYISGHQTHSVDAFK